MTSTIVRSSAKGMRNKEISDLLASLVALKSPSGSEQAAMKHVELAFKRLRIPVNIQKVDRRSNLVSSAASEKRPFLLLCSHIDTVPPDGSQLHGMRIGSRRISGLGACDAKASIVAMVMAYRDLVYQGMGDHVAVAFFVGEEESGDGGMTYIRNGYRPQYAIVGEPTELSLPWAQAGYLQVSCVAKGTPRHAFCLHGLDAMGSVVQVVRFAQEVVLDLSRELPKVERPNLFLQYLHGGSRDRFWYLRHSCSASFVINTHPSWKPEELIASLKNEIRRLNSNSDEVLVKMRIESWDPGFAFSSPALRSAIRRAMRMNNIRYRRTYMRSWTDAATLIWKGVPTTVIGPGSLQHAHSPNEQVRLDDIRKAANLYRDTARELLKAR